MIGMITSPTSEVTMAPKAAPMITPTARSTTLPFIANSRNSFSMLASPLRSSGEVRCSLVDQPGVHHGAAHGDPRRLGHRHHRQPQLLLDLAEQRERVFHRRRIAFDEEVVVQRHQLVMQLERGGMVALLPCRVEFRTEPRRDV